MNILINKFTNRVSGLNRMATTMEIDIRVGDDFKLVKSVDVINETTGDDGAPIHEIVGTRSIDIMKHPDEFTATDVLGKKYTDMINGSQYDNIIADIFLNEDDLDLGDTDHSANTGIATVQLLPHGQAKTKIVSLDTPSSRFEILEYDADNGVDVYISDVKFINGVAIVPSPISQCTIKFVNNTDRHRSVRSYAIAY